MYDTNDSAFIELTNKAIFPVLTNTRETEMSVAQQSMWFLDAINKKNTSYVITLAYDLHGTLNINALKQSIQSLLNRHPLLKSYYPEVNGLPVKKLIDELIVELNIIDKSTNHLSNQALYNYVNSLANKVFDLNQPPLIHFNLIALSHERHVFVISMHHIIADGWSLGVLLQDISEAYNAYNSGSIPTYSTTAGSYDDYVQNYDLKNTNSFKYKNSTNYWQKHLEHFEPLNFPYDYPRSANQQFKSKKYEEFFDRHTTDLFETLCKKNSVTLYMGLMTVFSFVLMRYTGQHDIILGTPVANRIDPKFEHTIGLFVNTLIVRLKFEENPSFMQALLVVKEEMLTGLENQNMPFEKIVELIQPDRTSNSNPIFQIMFALQNAYNNSINFNAINSTEILADTQISRFDLESIFWRTSNGIKWRIVYNEDLISENKCKAMMKHFRNILKCVTENAAAKLYDIFYLDQTESNYLNNISKETIGIETDASLVCTHEIISNNSALFADKIAINEWGNSLTYNALEERSSHVACILLNRFMNVKKQAIIAVCMETGIDLAITVLAVFKAGMVIVPLNYDDPEERINSIINNANANAIITDNYRIKSERAICFTELADMPINTYQEITLPIVKLNDLAYIIYTSGTTGNPKGVMIEHQGLSNTLMACNRAFQFNTSDVFGCASVFAFDIFFFEFFSALISGGTTYLINKRQLLDPELIGLIIQKITCMHLVPGVASALLNILKSQNIFTCPRMRQFATGGDLVNNLLLTELTKQFPHSEISVLYGPTETSILASRYAVKRKYSEARHPIGIPLDNNVILICDRYGNPQPIGIPGEIYIGGPGVARGYLHNPELNKHKFISKAEKRYFKTGDLARWLPDGTLDFIGRTDNQIKIRGHRIELGEINTAFYSHPAVKEVISIDRIIEKNKQILSYILLKEMNTKDTYNRIIKELKELLRSKLPHYMVPSHIEIIDYIPLTKNGKINRDALPTPTFHNQFGRSELNSFEQKIHNSICQVLGLESIDKHASFFDIGGNSLLSIQVAIKLRKEHIQIKPQDLFKYQTIAELGEYVAEKSSTSTNPEPIHASTAPYSESKSKEKKYMENNKIKNILLLGSTGYLGIHFLNQLINHNVTIYCLVRGNTTQSAVNRIKKLYQFYFPQEHIDKLLHKVVIIKGDISFSNFKLNEQDYKNLALTIDTIINAAANVNHVGNTADLTSVNVNGVNNIITFSHTETNKVIHHISTVGIKGLYNNGKVTFDEGMLNISQIHTEDYSESKYKAELLLHDYLSQGGKVNVYRVGTIGPHFSSGKFQHNISQHFLSRYINSTINLGIAGNWHDRIMDITPVDILAESILTLLFNSELMNKIFHMVSPHAISFYELVRFMQNCGYSIRIINADEFKHKLFSLKYSEEIEQFLNGIIQLIDSHESQHNGLSCELTKNILADLGFNYPILTGDYLKKFINYGIQMNYFTKPRYWDELDSYPELLSTTI